MIVLRAFVCVVFLAMAGCVGMELEEEGEPIGEIEPSTDMEPGSDTSFESPRVDLEETWESADAVDLFAVDEVEHGETDMRWECGGDPWVCCRGCGGWPDGCTCCVWNGTDYDC